MCPASSVRAFEDGFSGRPPGITFRVIEDCDQDFLRSLYASTRAEELSIVPWPKEQKVAFLSSQFNAQHHYYTAQFPNASFLIVEHNGNAVGRVYLDRREHELRLIDIALMPESRGQGLGTALLMEIFNECRFSAIATRIHVEKNNPAMSLYLRLGFKPVQVQGVYDLLEWSPS